MYVLTAFLSPSTKPPCFVIPAFTVSDSNHLYVQDLTSDGKVKRFALVNTELFYSVSVIPTQTSICVGGDGILAFWLDPATVELASTSEAIQNFSRYATNEPFADFELSSLTGDDLLLEKSASEIARVIGDNVIGSNWLSRETGLRGAADIQFDEPAQSTKINVDEVELQFLLANPDLIDWARRWRSLFFSSKRRSDALKDAGIWWLSIGKLTDPLAWMILVPLLYVRDDRRVSELAHQYLTSCGLELSGWPDVWEALSDHKDGDVFGLRQLGLSKLETLSALSKSAGRWDSVWSNLWYSRFGPQRLINLALSFLGRGRITINIASNVLLPLLHEKINEPVLASHAYNFLRNNVRSLSVWAELFSASTNFELRDEELIDLGLRWCRNHGGNMNSWESVWDYIRQRVEPKLAVSVGLEWLSRARWDLRTWPSIAFKTVVLAKEADDLRLLSDRLDRWLELPFSSPKSRAEVRKAKSLLVDKLEAAT